MAGTAAGDAVVRLDEAHQGVDARVGHLPRVVAAKGDGDAVPVHHSSSGGQVRTPTELWALPGS
ncbi:MAG: hypothetical protein ACRDQA_26980 [Nocardioidaceae bacterium]